MTLRQAARRFVPLAAAALVATTLTACGSSLALVSNRTQGYVLNQDQLDQIRPGQSQDLVVAVLGSPMTTNSFGEETAFYYIETKVQQTAFGMTVDQQRTVLAVYFDKNRRVTDKAIYTAKDGRVFTIESRRTASFGEDRTFIESIVGSLFTDTGGGGGGMLPSMQRAANPSQPVQ
jgi:outer membrane protein assembly factor BamE (lipoprotein component of BamABCDE complex)